MRFAAVLWSLTLLSSCGSPVNADGGTDFDAGLSNDAGTSASDAGQPDGVATTQACTNSFGSQLSTAHGRLDGLLVAIVPPGGRGCSSDADHVHLQVLAGGAVYDVAVNVHDTMGADVFFLVRDGAAVPFQWVEGWHPNERLGYKDLGLTAGDFTAEPVNTLVQQIENELAMVNHVSVYATGYGPTGAHDVHYRDGFSYDGAIIARPLGSSARTLYFHFANQAF